jgi:hypothetical protein
MLLTSAADSNTSLPGAPGGASYKNDQAPVGPRARRASARPDPGPPNCLVLAPTRHPKGPGKPYLIYAVLLKSASAFAAADASMLSTFRDFEVFDFPANFNQISRISAARGRSHLVGQGSPDLQRPRIWAGPNRGACGSHSRVMFGGFGDTPVRQGPVMPRGRLTR